MSATTITTLLVRAGPARFIIAWGFCVLFYFGQYALRAALGVMVPEWTGARQAIRERLVHRRRYGDGHGIDMPEIRNWHWAH
jgi:hypothetical protein